MHAQVVLCPGINDGANLDRTIEDLAELYPGVASVAVVPVGLTRHREGLFPLRSVVPEEAWMTLEQIGTWQEKFLKKLGSRFVFASDEFYLSAGEEVPEEEEYEGFPQLENGVGMVRRFTDTFRARMDDLPPRISPTSLTLVTGTAFGSVLEGLAREVEVRTRGLSLKVVPVENELLGRTVTVSGLLSGGDILRALEGTDPGNGVLLPPDCANDDGLLLDDVRPEDVAARSDVPVRVGSYDLVEAILKMLRELGRA